MKKIFALALCAGTLFSGSAFAGVADYVYIPTVEQGEKEIDFKFGSSPSGDASRVASLGVGYGATDYWFTEVYLKTEHEGSAPRLNILEWENKFQLTESGKYPVDVGLITEFEFPVNQDGAANEFKFGPLFQTEFNKLQLNGNLLFERKFGGDSDPDDAPNTTVFQYQWQAKYRWKQEFEFGLQGLGELGEWNHWSSRDAQQHKIGPAIFGKISLGGKQAIRYNAAWLIGTTSATPDNTFRMQLEYEFR
ncbi:hypothetical protein SKTS_34600 [Sulfurimicrobium lacus]|uniref:Transporter n=1 Tax=Sulfurimicrobium lacus TaxID=2715678 RepID=A0A6F8VFX1_9PROT|nr:hypothetical protein [Sulfurimicrobium lacus]BCB28574.1 hypothetical protein SKTS_34600 [Sulfurimicrobium lacus]